VRLETFLIRRLDGQQGFRGPQTVWIEMEAWLCRALPMTKFSYNWHGTLSFYSRYTEVGSKEVKARFQTKHRRHYDLAHLLEALIIVRSCFNHPSMPLALPDDRDRR